MSWQDEERARQAARLRRQQEWDEQHRERRPAPQWLEQEWLDPVGFGPAPAPYPAALSDIPPSSKQPAAVLLAWQLGRRDADPLTAEERGRDEVTARYAVGGTVDGRELLRSLAVRGEPDSGRLSGSRALALIRQLEIGGVGHEPVPAVSALDVLLEQAVAQCGFRCCECQSNQVRLDHVPADGPVPVITHWRLDDGSWCPCLAGGEAAAMASLDLLDALAAVVFVGDYGEPVGHLLVAA